MNPVRVFTTYPADDASRRLRIDPLVAALREEGRGVTVHTLLTPAMFADKNASGWKRRLVAAKLLGRLVVRCFALAKVRPSELVLVHREAFPFFTPLAERWLARRAAAVALDVDDALYAEPTQGPDWRRRFRSPQGFDGVLESVDLVLAGSPALAQRAKELGTEAIVSYTVPPPEARRLQGAPARQPTLVWTGSQSTLGSLRAILDDALAACEEVDGCLIALGGANVLDLPPHPRLRAERWTQERELEVLGAGWLGLMPLPETEWEAGKSAYKLLLYLFAGLPVLASPVGMNRLFGEAPGVTLVDSGQGWRRALLEALAEGRGEVGEQGRAWVAELVRPKEQLDRVVATLAGLGGGSRLSATDGVR